MARAPLRWPPPGLAANAAGFGPKSGAAGDAATWLHRTYCVSGNSGGMLSATNTASFAMTRVFSETVACNASRTLAMSTAVFGNAVQQCSEEEPCCQISRVLQHYKRSPKAFPVYLKCTQPCAGKQRPQVEQFGLQTRRCPMPIRGREKRCRNIARSSSSCKGYRPTLSGCCAARRGHQATKVGPAASLGERGHHGPLRWVAAAVCVGGSGSGRTGVILALNPSWLASFYLWQCCSVDGPFLMKP